MKKTLDIQGHRGCRGLYPENTIEGFVNAVNIGVNTLEMDVVVSKDNKVIVSHEPFFNHEITREVNGQLVTETNEKAFNLYQMSAEEIAGVDVGTKNHPRFEFQKKIKVHKPQLSSVFEKIEAYTSSNPNKIFYNIEIKRNPAFDGDYHPEVEHFIDLVMEVIIEHQLEDRVSIQCFDHETLVLLHAKYPNQQTVMLVENEQPPQWHLDKIGYIPTIYSPHFNLVNEELVSYCAKQKMKLIPWTVNEAKDAENLIKIGVDGIISDYPDMLIDVYNAIK